MNHLIGIQFLPFRFYAYFMAGIAIFAGFGLAFLMNELRLPRWLKLIATFIIAIYFAWPSYIVNAGYLNWQKNDPTAKASLQPYALEAIAWIQRNTPEDSQILAERRYGIWIRALGERQEIIFYDGNRDEIGPYVTGRLQKGPVYIFVPQDSALPLDKFNLNQIIYQQSSVTIYKVDP
jgi:hypothetical protein